MNIRKAVLAAVLGFIAVLPSERRAGYRLDSHPKSLSALPPSFLPLASVHVEFGLNRGYEDWSRKESYEVYVDGGRQVWLLIEQVEGWSGHEDYSLIKAGPQKEKLEIRGDMASLYIEWCLKGNKADCAKRLDRDSGVPYSAVLERTETMRRISLDLEWRDGPVACGGADHRCGYDEPSGYFFVLQQTGSPVVLEYADLAPYRDAGGRGERNPLPAPLPTGLAGKLGFGRKLRSTLSAARTASEVDGVLEVAAAIGVAPARLVEATNDAGEPALHEALANARAAAAMQLIRKGADVNRRTRAGTPLTLAAGLPDGSDGRQVTAALLDIGADVNAADDGGVTPLHVAAARDDGALVELLLERQAAAGMVDKRGQTALHHAARNGSSNVIQQLAARGADVNARDANGETPIYYAAEAGHTLALLALLARGARAQPHGHDGYSPLHAAAANGQTEVVDLLIRAGADVNARTAPAQLNGLTVIARLAGAPLGRYTAYDLAKTAGHDETAKHLRSAGGEVGNPITAEEAAARVAAELAGVGAAAVDKVGRLISEGAKLPEPMPCFAGRRDDTWGWWTLVSSLESTSDTFRIGIIEGRSSDNVLFIRRNPAEPHVGYIATDPLFTPAERGTRWIAYDRQYIGAYPDRFSAACAILRRH